MAFKPLLPSTSTRPKSEALRYSAAQEINTLVSVNFHSTTLLLIGAILQGTLLLIIPRIWVLLPTILILVARFADTMAVTFHLRPNPYLQDTIYPKWSAVMPDKDGNFSDTPADEKVAVLLLCAKVNHPLGLLAPNVKEVADRNKAMNVELDSEDPADGFLGQTAYTTTDNRGAIEIMGLSYWRSIEDIHNYANGPTHMDTVKWWNDMSKKNPEGMKYIGISHEIYEAPKGKWEAISLNFQPTRIGATTYLKKGDKMIGGVVDDSWISPVVDARGKLWTSKGRLNYSGNVNSAAVSGSGYEKSSY